MTAERHTQKAGGGGGGGRSRSGGDRGLPTGRGGSTGGGTSGGGGGSKTTVDCSLVSFQVVLSSPVPNVLAKLKAGDCLNVELATVGGEQVAVANLGKERAGIVPSSQYEALLYCLDQGKKFHAIVDSIRGGMCTVSIAYGACQ